MTGQEIAAKASAGIALPMLAALPIDWWWAVILPFGIVTGWLAQVGRSVHQRKALSEIRREMTVNLLIGFAQGLIASALIVWLDLDYLKGLVVAFACAFLGVQMLDHIVRLGVEMLPPPIRRLLLIEKEKP